MSEPVVKVTRQFRVLPNVKGCQHSSVLFSFSQSYFTFVHCNISNATYLSPRHHPTALPTQTGHFTA